MQLGPGRRATAVIAAAAGTVVLSLAGCSADPQAQLAGSGTRATLAAVRATPASPAASPVAAASVPASATPLPSRTLPAGLTTADVQAGLLSKRFTQGGSGKLVTVPGNVRAASSKGHLVRVKVQVEKGLRVNGTRFAAFVMNTLNDPRSWAHGGARHFSRVDGDYDLRVVLASPDTSARMCRPLQTFGRLSCHSGDAAIMTMYRWVNAIPDYGRDRTSYRHYLVNHEVGHGLGHGHEYCPGKGRIAPVMQQQTKSLQGCRVNPWPYP